MPFDERWYLELLGSPAPTVGGLVSYRERTASTMEDARAGAAARREAGTVYVAGAQDSGRGRQGRTWVSRSGAGLYATYQLRTLEVGDAPLFALAGGMAAGDAVLDVGRVVTALKWPNDVLVPGVTPRKIAGVLAESRPRATGAGVDVFLGIGINVREDALPPEVAAIATSIEGAGGEVPEIEALLAALSRALGGWLALLERDPKALVEAWKRRLVTLGQRVRLATPSGEVEGQAVDVTASGELVLRLEGGVGSSRVDLQACKLEYSIVSPK